MDKIIYSSCPVGQPCESPNNDNFLLILIVSIVALLIVLFIAFLIIKSKNKRGK